MPLQVCGFFPVSGLQKQPIKRPGHTSDLSPTLSVWISLSRPLPFRSHLSCGSGAPSRPPISSIIPFDLEAFCREQRFTSKLPQPIVAKLADLQQRAGAYKNAGTTLRTAQAGGGSRNTSPRTLLHLGHLGAQTGKPSGATTACFLLPHLPDEPLTLPFLCSLLPAGLRVRRSLLSPKPCQTSTGTRSGCEAGGSTLASPTSGCQDLPARTSRLMGKEGLVTGQGQGQQEVCVPRHPSSCPSH